MITTSDVVDSVSFLKPKPSPFSLVRIGKNEDGAYLVPDDLDGVTACFSPGVNNFKDFEDHLVRDFGIRCHMCDFSSDINNFKTPLVDGMQTFQKKWLDVDGSKDSLSLEEWVEELEPNNEQDLILQMDIEGAELAILKNSFEEVARFDFVGIEIDFLCLIPFLAFKKRVKGIFEARKILKGFEKSDFNLLHTENFNFFWGKRAS
jgi:hypothetical protein